MDEDGSWKFEVSPAISRGHRVWTKVVATDDEYVTSYIFEHAEIEEKGKLIYEVEDWLADFWISEDEKIYASGEDQVHYSKNGVWNTLTVPVESILSSIWGLSCENIYATGEGCILQLQEKKLASVFTGTKEYIDRIHGSHKSNIFAVGRKGTIVFFNGKLWRLIDSPTNVDLNSVYVATDNDVWIVGADATILRGDQNQWLVYEFDGVDFLDIISFSDEIYVAAGTDGLYRFWSNELVLVKDDIEANRLSTDGVHLCVSGGSKVSLYDGQLWRSYEYKMTI